MKVGLLENVKAQYLEEQLVKRSVEMKVVLMDSEMVDHWVDDLVEHLAT